MVLTLHTLIGVINMTDDDAAHSIAAARMVDIADFLVTINEKDWPVIYNTIYSAALDGWAACEDEHKKEGHREIR